MRARGFIIIAIFFLLQAGFVHAKPQPGFLKGPYLALTGGIQEGDFDRDLVSGTKAGNTFEPEVGLLFGWNVYDWLGAEIQGRYSTTSASGNRREHLIATSAATRFILINDHLLDFETLRILPFVKSGVASMIGLLPGTPQSSDQSVTMVGVGPMVGGGVSFLWKRFFYFGIDVQEDLLFFENIHQHLDLAPAPSNALVYRGGFRPQFSAMLMVGVHY